MKKHIILFMILLAALTNIAQKQANFWYFGEYAGLNFGLGVPVPLTDGALDTGEGCSSISTPSGNLEFYTDGTYVYDKNNDQMPHGSGLLGIIPAPSPELLFRNPPAPRSITFLPSMLMKITLPMASVTRA